MSWPQCDTSNATTSDELWPTDDFISGHQLEIRKTHKLHQPKIVYLSPSDEPLLT